MFCVQRVGDSNITAKTKYINRKSVKRHGRENGTKKCYFVFANF